MMQTKDNASNEKSNILDLSDVKFMNPWSIVRLCLLLVEASEMSRVHFSVHFRRPNKRHFLSC